MNGKTILLFVCFLFFALFVKAEKPQETKQLRQNFKSAVVKKARVPITKNFQLFCIKFSWEVSQQGNLSLKYLFSSELAGNPKFALIKGVEIADIKDPAQYKFSKMDFRKQRTILGEVRVGEMPIQLNEVVIFKTYRNCFVLSPVRVIRKAKNISVFYKCKDLSKVHLEKPAQNK